MTVYTSKISVSSVFKQNLGRNDVKKHSLSQILSGDKQVMLEQVYCKQQRTRK